ncbi:effector-associated constant component EACC1 [Streptomyces olivaceus]
MTDLVAEIEVTDEGEDDLRSLLRWLHEDEDLDVRGRPVGAPTPSGAMGTGFDLLQLSVGSGLSTASLLVSVLQWQTSRRHAPAVTLRRGEVEVVLTPRAARDEETLQALVDLLDRPAAGLPTPRREENGSDGGTP